MNNNKTRQTIKTYTTHNKTLNNKKRKTQTFLCFITNNIKSVWAMVTCIIKKFFFFPFNLHVLDPESAPPSGSSRSIVLGFIWKKQHYDETNNQEFIKDCLIIKIDFSMWFFAKIITYLIPCCCYIQWRVSTKSNKMSLYKLDRSTFIILPGN